MNDEGLSSQMKNENVVTNDFISSLNQHLKMTTITLRIDIEEDTVNKMEGGQLWTAKTVIKGQKGSIDQTLLVSGTTELIAYRNMLEELASHIRNYLIRDVKELDNAG